MITKKQLLLKLLLAITLTSCSSVEVKYPDKQTNTKQTTNKSSSLIVARSAHEFSDKDIQVPANFDTQGLELCNFSTDNEVDGCPLKKKSIRIYFGDNRVISKNTEEQSALKKLTNDKLGLMLENQLAGINRFRIVTRDDEVVNKEKLAQLEEQDVMVLAKLMQEKKVLRPDYAVKIDTVKTAERYYAEYNGMARYNLEMTTSVIDPYTKEKLAYPNIGKIRVKGTDVRNKEFFVYTEVNSKYYTGYDYANEDNIAAVFSGMVSKSFDVLLSRLMTEMPATAKVLGFRNGQASLDRGRNAGILNNETIILFKYEMGFVEPIAVGTARPSTNSAIVQIVRWKNNQLAKDIRASADNKIFKTDQQSIFAVSVGLPNDFLESRL